MLTLLMQGVYCTHTFFSHLNLHEKWVWKFDISLFFLIHYKLKQIKKKFFAVFLGDLEDAGTLCPL